LFHKDIIIGLIAVIIIAVATLGAQLLTKKYNQQSWLFRKLLHIISITTCAMATHYIEQRVALSITFFIFSILLVMAVYKKWLLVSQGGSFGIALFPFAFGILLAIPLFAKPVIICSIMVLAIADAMAGIMGKLFGRDITFLYEKKSIAGFISFLGCTIIIIALLFNALPWQTIWVVSIIIGLSELFSWRGSDNFTVPIIAAILLQGTYTDTYYVYDTAIFLLAAAIISPIAWQKKWLTTGGIFAAILVGGITIMYISAISILLPILFLGIGSLLSKLNNNHNTQEKMGRNAWQVFANGFVACLCCIAYGVMQQYIFIAGFVVSYAVSICDTGSSEIGVYCKGKTVNILNFRNMNIGLSGGISWQGTLGGIICCTLLVTVGCIIWQPLFSNIILVIGMGITGMLIDSLLGSILQAKYITQQKHIEEHPNKHNKLHKGYKYITNNVVNILSNAITVTLFLIIRMLY
jgi:uncharacterized protein (TIGR00297 family)